jgi:hypothetical protein
MRWWRGVNGKTRRDGVGVVPVEGVAHDGDDIEIAALGVGHVRVALNCSAYPLDEFSFP